MKFMHIGLAAVIAAAGFSVFTAAPAAAKDLYDETFKQPVVKNSGEWSAPSTEGTHQPCLTAATKTVQGSLPVCKAVAAGTRQPDAAGSGAFQLTDNSLKNSGALLLNEALDARQGLHIEFDMFQYNAYPNAKDPRKAAGGDGMSFFLIDGATENVKPGAAGGYLSYKDLPGAVVGVGFDQFGNFSNKAYWPNGDKGPGNKPDNIVVRGAQSTSYQYIQGVQSPAPLAVGTAKVRSEAKRNVNIDLSTANVLSVYVDYGEGKKKVISKLDLDNIDGQPKVPSTIKLGFGGATGDAGAIHEIQGFKVTSLDPDLKLGLTAAEPFKAGQDGTYTISVLNKPEDGPTVGDLTTTFDAPAGTTLRSITGDGWACTRSGARGTCTRPGTGADTLRPGSSTPPIIAVVAFPSTVSGQVSATAKVDTPNEWKPSDNIATVTSTVEKPAVRTGLRVDIKSAPNPYVPGEKVTYTATVSNDGPATAVGALLDTDWPKLMQDVPWTCKASAGSSCPAATGKGDISGAEVTVAAGGTVTFTLACKVHPITKILLEASATIAPPAGATDANCPFSCTVRDTNVGPRRP